MISKFDKAWAAMLVTAIVPIISAIIPGADAFLTPAVQAMIITVLATVAVYIAPNKA
jgi:hypothetical protein